MSKVQSPMIEQASGKFGKGIVFRNTKNGLVMAAAPTKASTPRRSEGQAKVRGQIANIAANFRLFDGKLALAFEGKAPGQNEFNLMVQSNFGVEPVFMPKQMRLNGGCIVAPLLYCRGSLPSIGMELQDGVLVSDIALGSLVIGANTTVAEFSVAVETYNKGWEDGDQCSFFLLTQYFDAMGTPRALMATNKVVLDVNDEGLLRDVAGAEGFSSVNGSGFGVNGYVLGMGQALQNAGASWTHSRDRGNGNIRVSTQRLYVVNDILADYQSYAAMKACADSYGGINTKAVYLNPTSSVVAEFNGSSGSNSGTTGTNTGGSGSGTNSGGSQQPVTVNAPTISGNTSFTDSSQVSMSAESGAEIRYTLDGSNPTASSTLYSAPFTLSETTTVRAVAIKDGVMSTVASRTFTKTESGGGGEGGGSGFNS